MDRRDFLHLTALGSLGAYALSGCAGGGGGSVSVPSVRPAPSGGAPAGKVMLGIDVLAAEGFARLQGLRCGLVTHRAGVNGLGQRPLHCLLFVPPANHPVSGFPLSERSSLAHLPTCQRVN